MRISDWSSDVCSSDLGDTNGDGIFQDPAYIPLVNDPIVNYGSATPGQIAAFHEFIENNSYLAARRGSIAERNGDRYSWVNQLDVSFQQRSEEHTSELQSLMRTSYAVFCLKKKKTKIQIH